MCRIGINSEWPYALYVGEPKTGVRHEDGPIREGSYSGAYLPPRGNEADFLGRAELHGWGLFRFLVGSD